MRPWLGGTTPGAVLRRRSIAAPGRASRLAFDSTSALLCSHGGATSLRPDRGGPRGRPGRGSCGKEGVGLLLRIPSLCRESARAASRRARLLGAVIKPTAGVTFELAQNSRTMRESGGGQGSRDVGAGARQRRIGRIGNAGSGTLLRPDVVGRRVERVAGACYWFWQGGGEDVPR